MKRDRCPSRATDTATLAALAASPPTNAGRVGRDVDSICRCDGDVFDEVTDDADHRSGR